MRYLRCKCGSREAWSSGMDPASCDGCDKCNTTLEDHPSLHRSPGPHEPLELWDVDFYGNKVLMDRRCRFCYKKLPS